RHASVDRIREVRRNDLSQDLLNGIEPDPRALDPTADIEDNRQFSSPILQKLYTTVEQFVLGAPYTAETNERAEVKFPDITLCNLKPASRVDCLWLRKFRQYIRDKWGYFDKLVRRRREETKREREQSELLMNERGLCSARAVPDPVGLWNDITEELLTNATELNQPCSTEGSSTKPAHVKFRVVIHRTRKAPYPNASTAFAAPRSAATPPPVHTEKRRQKNVVLRPTGGILGLWLGISLLSVLEIFEFFYVLARNCFDQRLALRNRDA
uniref:Anoctamin n=1 Tax=Macrostomum lignano TaxID=282301 RepID=A0A1I8F298_9PLAT